MPQHVFISYARKDGSDEAERLYNDFTAQSIDAWRDTRDLDPYADFGGEIEQAIEAATHIAVCVTPDMRRTTAVGSYPRDASPFGVMGLGGNVWEWCLSKWASDYQHPEDNDAESTDTRCLRGGSWGSSILSARAASRFRYYPDYRYALRGFRVCAVGRPE